MKIMILGGGSFGTAMAIHLSKRFKVNVWEISKERVEYAKKYREHDLLKFPLNENIEFTNDISIAKDSNYVFVCVPSKFVQSTVELVKQYIKADAKIIVLSKGLQQAKPFYKVIEEILPNKTATVVGPTHAEEVCKAMMSAAIIASEDREVAKDIQKLLQDDQFYFEISDDPLGVSLASGLKNILAVIIGIMDGLGYGDNAKAFVMTKGLKEIMELGVQLGAKEDTFIGLAGLGDIIVTCTSQHSRNRFFGEQIGKGKTMDTIKMDQIVEGVHMTEIVMKLSKENKFNVPLFESLYDVLFNNKKVEEMFYSSSSSSYFAKL